MYVCPSCQWRASQVIQHKWPVKHVGNSPRLEHDMRYEINVHESTRDIRAGVICNQQLQKPSRARDSHTMAKPTNSDHPTHLIFPWTYFNQVYRPGTTRSTEILKSASVREGGSFRTTTLDRCCFPLWGPFPMPLKLARVLLSFIDHREAQPQGSDSCTRARIGCPSPGVGSGHEGVEVQMEPGNPWEMEPGNVSKVLLLTGHLIGMRTGSAS